MMLRACYLVSKRDPSVIVGDATATTTENDSAAAEAFHNARAQSNKKTNHFMFVEALPANLLQEYQTGSNRRKKQTQQKLLSHVTNYVARTHNMDNATGSSLQPSTYLDLCVTR
jgi:hypothetical protein